MKVIAFYLPQYHCIPENDLWWGEGFTEWTNTRRARPLFAGHYQPREPYGNYYYDLTNLAAQEWQADIARQYGVYGFCYYHYWFRGKSLLETPLTNMLLSGRPNYPFCLSWANESWTRAWDGSDNEVLIAQSYGGSDEWEEHFQYLVRAFRDPRYIRVDNKPLLLIYRPASIPCCEDMLDCWNNVARRNGFEGIFFTETLGFYERSGWKSFDAYVEFEPMFTIGSESAYLAFSKIHNYKRSLGFSVAERPMTFQYDRLWTKIITRTRRSTEERTFLGAFVDWDNTPRKSYRGIVVTGATPEAFEKYTLAQIANSGDPAGLLFVNAWNEWGEGAYLEPDQRSGYAYLAALQRALARATT